jgi:hypothetical protein
VSDVVGELESADELAYIFRVLDEGTGADRQLRVYGETGDLNEVVDYLIEQTEQGSFEAAEPATAQIMHAGAFLLDSIAPPAV